MTDADRLRELLDVQPGNSAGELVATVPRERWVASVTAVRDDPVLDLRLFDLLTAVDEREQGFDVLLRLWSPAGRRGLQLHTGCPSDDARVPSLAAVFGGAAWHERATAEMFGIEFEGHPNLVPLLLPDRFAGHPLRKDFVLASRVAKPWPGAPEPGQSAADARVAAAGGRRRQLPPGVPKPGSWGSS